MIAVYASTTREQFIALAPSYLGNTYQGIIESGKDLPAMVPISMAFYPLMASAGFASGANNSY